MAVQSCELVMLVTSLACCLAQDRSQEEIALISSVLNQLGDTLATISAQTDLCCPEEEEEEKCSLS